MSGKSCIATRGMSLLELMVVLAIIGILIALLIPAIQRVRSAALHTESTNNLRQIGLAMHGYQGVNRFFPRVNGFNPATKEFEYSFFVGLLPHIEQGNVYRAFKEKFAKSGGISDEFRIPVFISPLDPTLPSANVSYAANGSAFARRANFSTFIDGSSNTVGLAEHYSYGCGGVVFTWTQAHKSSFNMPGVLDFRRASFADKAMGDVIPVTKTNKTLPSVAGLTFQATPSLNNCDPRLAQSLSPNGMLTGFVDGSVRTLSPSISASTYWSSLTPRGGEVPGADW